MPVKQDDNKNSIAGRFINLLISPWAILASIAIGIVIGLYYKNISAYIAPVGHVYLSLLQMAVLPIMISAVILSLGRMIRSQRAGGILAKFTILFLITMMLTGVFGLMLGFVIKPGIISTESKKTLGNIMLSSESAISRIKSTVKDDKSTEEQKNISDIVFNIIPSNIFKALTEGNNLQILFFIIIFSMMLKFVPEEPCTNLFYSLESVYIAFEKAVDFSLYLLPFGLIALIAEQFNAIGVEILYALLKFILVIIGGVFIQFIISTIIISILSRNSLIKVIQSLKEAMFISLATRSSVAAIPSSLKGLTQGLKFNSEMVNLSIPLGFTIARYANMFVFPLTVMFISQIYGIDLTAGKLFCTLMLSIFAAMATAGAPGMAALSMVSIVLVPLGLPASTGVIILIALDPIIDPFLTLLNQYSNCALSAMISKHHKSS